MEDLKPCPFCGGIARIQEEHFLNGDTAYKTQCRACFSSTTLCWHVDEATWTWNRRIESGD